MDNCFACGKRLKENIYMADTRDAQIVYVGKDCWKKIQKAGEMGYQPKFGPRLYPIKENNT